MMALIEPKIASLQTLGRDIGGERDMLTTPELLARIRELKPRIRERYKAKELELFGSSIRGEQTQESDIDILVEFEESADVFDLVGLALFLEGELKRKVDVVPKQALREELRDSILAEAVPI
jgi:predicted nucleotidyltransferase